MCCLPVGWSRRLCGPLRGTAGRMVADVREVFSVDGDGRLTIEKTQSTAWTSATLKAVYERTSSIAENGGLP